MREEGSGIWTYIFMLLFVAGMNLFFKDFRSRSYYKNISSHERETYDSAVYEPIKVDSLLTFKK